MRILLLALLATACQPSTGTDADDTVVDDTVDTTDTTETDDSPPRPSTLPPVCINEYMSSNVASYALPDGTHPDWIELHNPTEAAIDLTGWTLSDDPAAPDKHVLPSGSVLQAGQYLVLIADNDPEEGPEHLSFSLARVGETVTLADLEGRRDVVRTIANAAADFAYARSPDCCVGDCWLARTNGTPGAPNAN